MDKKVQILLSTYNGEKYLCDQLDSLLNQDYKNIHILIRDDGSYDETLEILKEYERKEKIKVIYGKNIGVVKSYFELLEMSCPKADFIAFCDQDDVWLSDKISRSLDLILELPLNKPILYCSRQILVDENLNRIGYTYNLQKQPSFNNAIIQNIAVGCTILINSRAKILISKNIPSNAVMHDWWLYLVVSAFGNIIFDKESKILYRQHANNQMGYKKNTFEKWKFRIIRFCKNNIQKLARKQAVEFFNIYKNELSAAKLKIIRKFLVKKNIIHRLKYLSCSEVYMQSKIDDFLMRLLILFGRV